MKETKKDKNAIEEDYFSTFPEQIRNMNIIPSYDKPGPKQVGYKWKDYESKPFPRDELIKHEGNYAMITGDPFNEGYYLIVIDIDNPIFCRYFKNENTFTVKTPGGGYHLFYKSKTPLRNKNFLYRLPIDIRGVGGYLMIPPSKYGDREYYVVKDNPIEVVKSVRELIETNIPLKLRKLYEEDKDKDIKQFKDSLHKDKGISLLNVINDIHENEDEWYNLDLKEEKGDIIRLRNPLRYQREDHSFLIFNALNKWYDMNEDKSGDVLDYIEKKMNTTSNGAITYLAKEYRIKRPVIEKTLDDFFASATEK